MIVCYGDRYCVYLIIKSHFFFNIDASECEMDIVVMLEARWKVISGDEWQQKLTSAKQKYSNCKKMSSHLMGYIQILATGIFGWKTFYSENGSSTLTFLNDFQSNIQSFKNDRVILLTFHLIMLVNFKIITCFNVN